MKTKSKNESTLADLPAIDEHSADFRRLLELLLARSNASNRMEALTADTNANFLGLVEVAADEWAELQQLIADCDPELEALSRKHPEWFGDKKSIKTPVGTVKFHKSTVLEVSNEELSIVLIDAAIQMEHEKMGDPALLNTLHGLVKAVPTLNIEALEQLPDELLKQFRIKRVDKENFSFTPAKVDLGKVIKASGQEVADKREESIA